MSGPLRVEIDEWARARYGDHAAMQHSAGDAREFRAVDLAIGLAGMSERSARRVEIVPERGLEKQPLDPAGIAVEQGLHGSKPANP
jgi:hypothetical protein